MKLELLVKRLFTQTSRRGRQWHFCIQGRLLGQEKRRFRWRHTPIVVIFLFWNWWTLFYAPATFSLLFFSEKTFTLIMYFYLIQLCFPNFHCVFNIQVCFADSFQRCCLILTFKWEKKSWSVLKPSRIENFIMQVYFFNAFLSRLWEYI